MTAEARGFNTYRCVAARCTAVFGLGLEAETPVPLNGGQGALAPQLSCITPPSHLHIVRQRVCDGLEGRPSFRVLGQTVCQEGLQGWGEPLGGGKGLLLHPHHADDVDVA